MNSAAQHKSLHRLDESLLGHVPAFSQLQRPQIRQILDQASCKRYPAGVTVFSEGAQADRFYMLLDGVIQVMRIGAHGERVISLHIPAGQLFGIARALGHTTYPATAVTAVESIGLSWPSTLWDDYVARYTGFATETYKTVGARINEMNTHVMELATLHVQQRVAQTLLRLANQTGSKVATGIQIDFPLTRQDLSDMTGTTLHTVSRLLSAWEKQGLLTSKSKRITICDAHQLVVLSQARPDH